MSAAPTTGHRYTAVLDMKGSSYEEADAQDARREAQLKKEALALGRCYFCSAAPVETETHWVTFDEQPEIQAWGTVEVPLCSEHVKRMGKAPFIITLDALLGPGSRELGFTFFVDQQ